MRYSLFISYDGDILLDMSHLRLFKVFRLIREHSKKYPSFYIRMEKEN